MQVWQVVYRVAASGVTDITAGYPSLSTTIEVARPVSIDLWLCSTGMVAAHQVAEYSVLLLAAVSLGTKITHYITTTQGQTTPVQKAKVSLFQYPYGEPPVAGPVCTTDTNGTCTVDLKQLVSGSSYGQLAAVVEAAGHGPLVIWSIQTPSSYEDSSLSYSYVGDLVVDRVIVMPGDKLHVTGEAGG